MTKEKRKKCSSSECRRFAIKDTELCRKCSEASAGSNPIQEVRHISEVQLLTFLNAELKLSSARKDVFIIDAEQQKDDFEYRDRKVKRSQRKLMVEAEIQRKSREYRAFIETLAQEFDISVDNLAIDDVTGVVRDLSEM